MPTTTVIDNSRKRHHDGFEQGDVARRGMVTINGQASSKIHHQNMRAYEMNPSVYDCPYPAIDSKKWSMYKGEMAVEVLGYGKHKSLQPYARTILNDILIPKVAATTKERQEQLWKLAIWKKIRIIGSVLVSVTVNEGGTHGGNPVIVIAGYVTVPVRPNVMIRAGDLLIATLPPFGSTTDPRKTLEYSPLTYDTLKNEIISKDEFIGVTQMDGYQRMMLQMYMTVMDLVVGVLDSKDKPLSADVVKIMNAFMNGGKDEDMTRIIENAMSYDNRCMMPTRMPLKIFAESLANNDERMYAHMGTQIPVSGMFMSFFTSRIRGVAAGDVNNDNVDMIESPTTRAQISRIMT